MRKTRRFIHIVRGLWAVARVIVGARIIRAAQKDVLVLSMPNPHYGSVMELRENLNDLGITNDIIALRSDTTLHIVPEATMRRLGWQRIRK